MLSQRGQEEAPFELLIAVIIMAFVIFLGLQAMKYVETEQCKAQIKQSASELKTVVQEVVAGNNRVLYFNPPQCFTKPKDKEEMRFVVIKDSLQCSSLCGGSKSECFVFVFSSEEYEHELCLETVSPQTTFFELDPPCSLDNEKLIPVNLKDGIPRGSFEFMNKSSFSDAFPKICAYLKKGG